MKYHIRSATPEDASTVILLIEQFAIHESIPPEEVRLTPTIFREYCFGPKKCFECDVGFLEEVPVSYALYSTRFSGWLGSPVLYLEDLFVMEEYRNRGMGKSLLAHVAKVALRKGCVFMEWVVADWNEDAQKVYQGLGARLKNDLIVCRLNQPELSNLVEEQ